MWLSLLFYSQITCTSLTQSVRKVGMFPILLLEVALRYIVAKLSLVWEQVPRLSTCLTSVLIIRLEIFLSFSEPGHATVK